MLATPISMNSIGVDGTDEGRLQQRNHAGAQRHRGRVEHVDAGDHAGAAVDAGPGLHRREHRHDEQAAGNRQAGEIDSDANAAQRSEDFGDAPPLLRRREAPGGEAEIEREDADQDRAEHRRQQDDAPGGKPGRQTGADRDRDREDGQAERCDLFGAAERVLDQRRQQHEREPADSPEPAGDDRAPPDARVFAQLLQEIDGGDDNVGAHDQIGRRLRRSAE